MGLTRSGNKSGYRRLRLPAVLLAVFLLQGSISLLYPEGSAPLSPAIPTPENPQVRQMILKGIELTINNRFAEAFALFGGLTRQYPASPIGYFYQAATLQSQMLDAEDYSRVPLFHALMDSALLRARALREAGRADAWNTFYEGSAYLYRSFMDSKLGDWLGAYRNALRGVKLLEKAVAQDSTLYDAYLGIGSFKYWKGAKSKIVLWLPFISDEREKGIQLIRKAINKGRLVHWIARDQLAWILMNAGDCEEAVRISQENLEQFPRSRFFKWTLVAAAYRCGKWALSKRLYRELLEEIRQMPENNHYNELECLVKLAEIGCKEQDWSAAYRWADQALRLAVPPAIRKRAHKKLKRALEIRQQASQELEKTQTQPFSKED